jgi:hypothetical protein
LIECGLAWSVHENNIHITSYNDESSHTTHNPITILTTTATTMSKAVFLLFLFSTRLVGAADEDRQPPNLDDMMGGRSCPNFKCTGGLAVVPKSRAVKFDTYGCNAMGSGMMMYQMGSNDKDEEPHGICCDQWHACYQVCGVSKASCDRTFSTCVETVCGTDETCNKNAKVSHMSIQFGGCQKYDQAQYKSCECVPKEKAIDKRETVIRNFYKKFSPDSMDKAADLAKKADTASKMASLLRKLIKKYPESIQRKVDPKRKEMDDMMRQTEGNGKKYQDNGGEDSTEEEEENEDEKIEL